MITILLALSTFLSPWQQAQTQPSSQPATQVQRVKARRPDKKKSLARCLAQATDWLATQQLEDGRWRSLDRSAADKGNRSLDVGVTGLALLALLSEGHSPTRGKHKASVAKAVAWLLEQQDPKTGRLGPAGSVYRAYNHALATWALVELLGVAAEGKQKAQIQRAILHTQQRRNPYKAWRYYPRDGDNDSSITGWMMLGLLAAERRNLARIKTDKQMALSWYQEVTDPQTGRVGYTKRGQGSSRNEGMQAQFPAEETEALTALSLLVQLRCGKSPDKEPMLRLAIERILEQPPQWAPSEGKIDLYYWFFGSMALAEAEVREAKKWNAYLMAALMRSQSQKGKTKGSWEPVDAWSTIGGRTYMSALAILSLSAATGKSRLLRR